MRLDRSTIESSISIRSLLMVLVFLSASIERVEGRRCVCTSKACKEAGVDTCKTKFSCYTELILTGDQKFGENATTRGCTEGATPLLCETKSWVTRSKSNDNADRSSAAWIRMPWPRLKCCDTHDYCNADHRVNVSTWTHDEERPDVEEPTLNYPGAFNGISSHRDVMGSIQPDPGPTAGGRESSDQLLQNRVKPLHVAALVLAIAALISVLAACYVITRFLKTNPYTVGSVE
ncbi:uncharacterized protein LOC128886537 [Hylaeus anthracinus]|uniref:uncharacterized protein LOC128878447 n=1 Tax=Hylaeus volcanicus TaxID=313075 RepID=UPI0023B7BD8D|nr:uncharacterized protein LOC128878447 [Hylaeus volcanicus]XP_053982630.1 uncharacterized protein LOC128878447 [Hylaeus volcanicus]XP_053982631.1 uncharacterized protein LOC128878447 [Hylaeus volcanicus]XP_053982632.1 uncharacterized protein LOC128878447 [Hylaeus volcanicus]XP_053982633.1 uncharacterized protein LOC128878447 [Hylaeus volcanicus]XP_053997458.1 uncharacterized protein LOC128886537 [Hylaeus anthracinus]XP_053997460.1 uncharacterized protein LOC128886537 [Hylaeus anthracinus]XP